MTAVCRYRLLLYTRRKQILRERKMLNKIFGMFFEKKKNKNAGDKTRVTVIRISSGKQTEKSVFKFAPLPRRVYDAAFFEAREKALAISLNACNRR